MRILRKYYVLIVTFCAFFFSSTTCNEPYLGENFSVENCDNDIIYVFHERDPEPDFVLNSEFVFVDNAKWLETRLIPISSGSKSKVFQLGYYDHYYLRWNTDWRHQIIIYRKETLDKYSVEELIEKNIYDALYDLSTKDILDMETNVRFPLKDQEEGS